MNSEKCFLIQDLLPSYIDEVCSDETSTMIKKHLEECETCRNIYNDMKSDVPGTTVTARELSPSPVSGTSDEFEKTVLKRISDDIKRKNRTSIIISVIAGVTALFILFGFTAPVIPVSLNDMDAKVTIATNNFGEEVYKYDEIPDTAILLFDDDKKLDECNFHLSYPTYKTLSASKPINDSFGIVLAVDEEFMDNSIEGNRLPYDVQIIELYSNKNIKSYKTETVTDSTGTHYVIKNVRTTLFGNFNNKGVTNVTLLNVYDMDSIELKGIGSEKTVLWTKSK